MAVHAEYSLGCSGISQIFDLPLAIAARETRRAESLVPGQYCGVFDLVAACGAAISASITNEGSIIKEEGARVDVEEGAAYGAAKAI